MIISPCNLSLLSLHHKLIELYQVTVYGYKVISPFFYALISHTVPSIHLFIDCSFIRTPLRVSLDCQKEVQESRSDGHIVAVSEAISHTHTPVTTATPSIRHQHPGLSSPHCSFHHPSGAELQPPRSGQG